MCNSEDNLTECPKAKAPASLVQWVVDICTVGRPIPFNYTVSTVLFQVYKNLFQALVTRPGALERPSFWKEIVADVEAGSKHDLIAKAKL